MRDLKHLVSAREAERDLQISQSERVALWSFVAGMMFFALLDMLLTGIAS